VAIGREQQRLEAERELALHEEANTAKAPIIGTGDACHPFIRLSGPAIQSDFDGERGPLLEEIGQLRDDERTIGEERDQQAFLLGVRVNLAEIFPDENFPAGKEEPETSCARDLVKDAAVFFVRQFRAQGTAVMKREPVVTVGAGKITPPRQVYRSLDGQPSVAKASIEVQRKIGIAFREPRLIG
jgi:hypothetical protein